MLIECIRFVSNFLMDTVSKSFFINILHQDQRHHGFFRDFIDHVLRLLDEFWYFDTYPSFLLSIIVNWNILLLLSKSLLFTELLNAIVEALGYILEHCNFRRGPPGANLKNNGGSFLLFQPLHCMDNCGNKSES